jgi:hypothetical protein
MTFDVDWSTFGGDLKGMSCRRRSTIRRRSDAAQ